MLSRKMKELRKANGLTQKELAMLVGVCVDSVRRWEHGTRKPRADELARFAIKVGVHDLDILFKEAV